MMWDARFAQPGFAYGTEPNDFLREVVSSIPKGNVVLEAYTPKQLEFKTGGPPVADLMPTLADLKAELAGLQFEIAREIEREIHEGKLHDGQSAVVQILARKI